MEEISTVLKRNQRIKDRIFLRRLSPFCRKKLKLSLCIALRVHLGKEIPFNNSREAEEQRKRRFGCEIQPPLKSMGILPSISLGQDFVQGGCRLCFVISISN